MTEYVNITYVGGVADGISRRIARDMPTVLEDAPIEPFISAGPATYHNGRQRRAQTVYRVFLFQMRGEEVCIGYPNGTNVIEALERMCVVYAKHAREQRKKAHGNG